MKLLTEEIKRKLAKYPICSQDGKGEEALVLCKFFNPYGDQTWYILEGDQEGDDYYLLPYSRIVTVGNTAMLC